MRESFFVNRRYQRKLVWTLEEKQKLIGSILKRYPVPAILIAERDGAPGTYEIIDGLQRLHTIVSYIENSFSLESGEFFAVDAFPTAKAAANSGSFQIKNNVSLISSREVSTILDYNLALSVMRNATDAEVNDVFDRINTYGHRLSDQERRQAGVQNTFSNLVRELACSLRGDSSAPILPLQLMPSISIDLPMANHGYEVRADEVFWVTQGILRSTDLRDSLDEQYIADICACIVGSELIERSKAALDAIYTAGSLESERILNALDVYGSETASDEIRFCISEILKVCSTGGDKKLRSLIFENDSTNAFPSVFSVIVLAFHELFIKEKKRISNYEGVKSALNNLYSRVDTSRKATAVEERRKNINTIKGLISSDFIVDNNLYKTIYANHTSVDIESIIRRSEVELANYELKQGRLSLSTPPVEDENAIPKLINTICAISNIGPHTVGKIIIGVTDKTKDAERAKQIYGIEPKKVGKRFVVGVAREAAHMHIDMETYLQKLRDSIKSSELSEPLRSSVLSSIDFNSYYGLGVIVITVPPQKEPSYVGEDMYWRNSDSTELAKTPKQIAGIAGRF